MIRWYFNEEETATEEEARKFARLAQEMGLDPSKEMEWALVKDEWDRIENEKSFKESERRVKKLEKELEKEDRKHLDRMMTQLEFTPDPEKEKEIRRNLEQSFAGDREQRAWDMLFDQEDPTHRSFFEEQRKKVSGLSATEKKIPLHCPFCSVKIGEIGVLTGGDGGELSKKHFCTHCGGVFTTKDALPPEEEVKKREEERSCPYCFHKARVPFIRCDFERYNVICPRCGRTYSLETESCKIPLGLEWNPFWKFFSSLTQFLGILLFFAFPVLLIAGICVGVQTGEKAVPFKYNDICALLVFSSIGAVLLSGLLLLLSLVTRPFFTREDRELEAYGTGLSLFSEAAGGLFSALGHFFRRIVEIVLALFFGAILSNAIFGRRK